MATIEAWWHKKQEKQAALEKKPLTLAVLADDEEEGDWRDSSPTSIDR
jgi:hypothetical protein